MVLAGANANKVSLLNSDAWTTETPKMDQELGSEFGWYDRLFFGYRDGMVFDYGDWEARDLQEFLNKDYKGRQIEAVLSQPIISATRTMTPAKGDAGEYEWLNAFWEADPLNGGCETSLDLVVDQMTTGITYKKAFWNVVWTEGVGDFAGKIVPSKYAWRPQTTCRAMRDAKTAALVGFEQEAYYTGPDMVSGIYPIQVPLSQALIFIHGARRDPINGTSDMEVAYWAWRTKQKLLFLWFQFLEGVSLPRVIAYAQEQTDADQIAGQVRKLKSSGAIGVGTQGSVHTKVDQLDLSGKGAEQFHTAIQWLDGCATNSVLAGFLDLTAHGSSRSGGPVGVHLAKDAGDFFLQTLETKTHEMQSAIRRDLFGPMLRHNFGPQARIPQYEFEPLNAEDKSASVTMLTDLLRSRDPALVPDEFIGELAQQVADYVGMDGDKIRAAFDKAAQSARDNAAKGLGPSGLPVPGMASPAGQAVAGVAGAVGAATKTVAQAKQPAGTQRIPGINAPTLPTSY